MAVEMDLKSVGAIGLDVSTGNLEADIPLTKTPGLNLQVGEAKLVQGPKGDTGGYYVPNLDEDGNLSFAASEANMPEVEGANIRGPKGEEGKSAYDLVKDAGYTGTAEEFAAEQAAFADNAAAVAKAVSAAEESATQSASSASASASSASAAAQSASSAGASAQSAASSASKAESFSSHPPIVNEETENWMAWDGEKYVDTGRSSKGDDYVLTDADKDEIASAAAELVAFVQAVEPANAPENSLWVDTDAEAEYIARAEGVGF